jgi:hypothetical protein
MRSEHALVLVTDVLMFTTAEYYIDQGDFVLIVIAISIAVRSALAECRLVDG